MPGTAAAVSISMVRNLDDDHPLLDVQKKVTAANKAHSEDADSLTEDREALPVCSGQTTCPEGLGPHGARHAHANGHDIHPNCVHALDKLSRTQSDSDMLTLEVDDNACNMTCPAKDNVEITHEPDTCVVVFITSLTSNISFPVGEIAIAHGVNSYEMIPVTSFDGIEAIDTMRDIDGKRHLPITFVNAGLMGGLTTLHGINGMVKILVHPNPLQRTSSNPDGCGMQSHRLRSEIGLTTNDEDSVDDFTNIGCGKRHQATFDCSTSVGGTALNKICVLERRMAGVGLEDEVRRDNRTHVHTFVDIFSENSVPQPDTHALFDELRIIRGATEAVATNNHNTGGTNLDDNNVQNSAVPHALHTDGGVTILPLIDGRQMALTLSLDTNKHVNVTVDGDMLIPVDSNVDCDVVIHFNPGTGPVNNDPLHNGADAEVEMTVIYTHTDNRCTAFHEPPATLDPDDEEERLYPTPIALREVNTHHWLQYRLLILLLLLAFVMI